MVKVKRLVGSVDKKSGNKSPVFLKWGGGNKFPDCTTYHANNNSQRLVNQLFLEPLLIDGAKVGYLYR